VQDFLYQTVSEKQAFEAYKLYVAIKNHFTNPTYDFFKYNGRTKASFKTFEKRPDKYFFYKLADRKDKLEYLVANFVSGADNWIGDLVNNAEGERCYRRLIGYRDSLTYQFTLDLDRLLEHFDSNFLVTGGQHPPLLIKYLRNEIQLETMVILDSLISYTKHWNKKIEDPVVWPRVSLKIKKFKPFLSFDQDKLKKLVVDKFSS
jgi:hypothetical protein